MTPLAVLGRLRRRGPITLRARLMAVGLSGLAAAMLVLGIGLYAFLSITVDATLDAEARARAQEVATMVAENRLPDPVPVAGAQLIQVVDREHRVVGGSLLADRLTPLLRPDELATALGGRAITGRGARAGLTGPLRTTALAAGRDGISVIVAQQVGDILTGRRVLRIALAITLPLVLLLAGLVAWRVIGRTLRPVEELRTGAERISGGTETEHLPVPPAADEIQALAVTLNGMLDRLSAARERQRAFVADAAHELRSPLASIRAQLEVAQRLGEGGTLTEDLLTDTHRLSGLVEDLLLLARADADRRRPAVLERVEVRELLSELAARPAWVPITLRSGQALEVEADRQELRRAVANLIDNAVRHAAERVELTAEPGFDATGSVIIISVLDDGPGVPAGERERVFDRFTRLDDARTRDAGGSGLGLAITRELVARAGGTVELEDGPADWSLRAKITMPGPTTDS